MRPISESVKRFDFDEKIAGTAQYCAALCYEGMLYAKTLRSEKARAKIRSVSVPPLPADYYIVDYRDLPGKNVVPIVYDDQPFFASDAVNYIGEPILLVVGPNRETLRDILRHSTVDYEERKPVLTLEEAMARTSDFIYGESPLFRSIRIHKRRL